MVATSGDLKACSRCNNLARDFCKCGISAKSSSTKLFWLNGSPWATCIRHDSTSLKQQDLCADNAGLPPLTYGSCVVVELPVAVQDTFDLKFTTHSRAAKVTVAAGCITMEAQQFIYINDGKLLAQLPNQVVDGQEETVAKTLPIDNDGVIQKT